MTYIYRATITPTKAEVIAPWLPKQAWFNGHESKVEIVSGYRVDDPAGEVGLQGLLVTAGDDTLYHVPVTYRDAELGGAEAHLIGTMEHSALGTRWVYDAIGDPVFQAVLAETIASGATEPEEFLVEADGSHTPRDPQSRLRGSGSADAEVPSMDAAKVATEDGVSTATSKAVSLAILRRIDPRTVFTDDVETLTCSWDGQAEPVVVATLHTKNARPEG